MLASLSLPNHRVGDGGRFGVFPAPLSSDNASGAAARTCTQQRAFISDKEIEKEGGDDKVDVPNQLDGPNDRIA